MITKSWQYIKITYKGGYVHYAITKDTSFYEKQKDVLKVERVEQQAVPNMIESD